MLGQVKIADKSYGIKAIPELFEMLPLRGCLVTIDAQGADYVLAVKDNQKRLEQAINQESNSNMPNSFEGDKYVTREKGHGRKETRLSMVVYNTDFLGDIAFDWTKISTIGC